MQKKIFESRPYQNEAIKAVLDAIEDGKLRLGIALPTGAGKTFVAGEIISKLKTVKRSQKVLWVAPAWEILHQSAVELMECMDLRGVKLKLGRIMGVKSQHPQFWDLLEEDSSADVVFTTINTWHAKAARYKRTVKSTLIMIDEFHHGEHAEMRTGLEEWGEKSGAVFIGLSATPNCNTEFYPAYSKPFSDLVPRYLAEPKKEEPFTGTEFDPNETDELTDEDGDKDPAYKRLGADIKRNQFIADYLGEHRNRLGKMMVFAVDQEHCDTLAKLIGKQIPATWIYYSGSDNRNAMKEFKGSDSGVLVTVRKAALGIDVPDLKTVVIARPTKSRKLHRQFIGRAARTNGGKKKKFYVVEFTDNIRRMGGLMYNTFGDSSSKPGKTHRSFSPYERESGFVMERAPKDYDFDRNGAMLPVKIEHAGELLNLMVRRGQTFGFEIELSKGQAYTFNSEEWQGTPKWRREASRLWTVLVEVLGPHVVNKEVLEDTDGEKDHRRWNVEWDGSCGWEVTSRVLDEGGNRQESSGLRETIKALSALNLVIDQEADIEAGYFRVNASTGLHLNLGYEFKHTAHLQYFLRLVRLIEPALAPLLLPSRIFDFTGNKGKYDLKKSNEYCKTLRETMSERQISELTIGNFKSFVNDGGEDGLKYRSINLWKYYNNSGKPYLEIRTHDSTTDPKRISLWLSTWMHIMRASENGEELDLPTAPKKEIAMPMSGEQGDIVWWGQEHLGMDRYMLSCLHEQRMSLKLKESWLKVDEFGPKMKALYVEWEQRFKAIEKRWELDRTTVATVATLASKPAISDGGPKGLPTIVVPLELSAPHRSLSFREFGSLGASDQGLVVKKILRTNNLSMTPDALTKSFLQNRLYVAKHPTEAKVSTIGHKVLNPKLKKAILDGFLSEGLLPLPLGSKPADVQEFIENVNRGHVRERGWALNEIKGSPIFIEMVQMTLNEILQMGYGPNQIFTSIRAGNSRGIEFSKRWGFVPVMKIKSPFSASKLIICIYRGPLGGKKT